MVPTRRQALASTGALLAALAGCRGFAETSTVDASGPENGRPENVAMDPPTVTLRRPGYREPIVEVLESGDEPNRTERKRRRAVRRGFVTSSEAASWLRIEDVAGADSARQFLADTDFEQSFVFVDRTGVDQCYRQVLCYVTWSAVELSRTYAEVYRDYDVACRTDERDRIARFVRLDGTVDARRVESGGTHTRRGGCPIPEWRRGDTDTPTGTETATESTDAGNGTDSARRLGGREG